jgi:hypothetical protein
MRLPTGFVKHRRAGLGRALIVMVVLFGGASEEVALALLPSDSGHPRVRPSDRAAAPVPVTAAPTPLPSLRTVAARAEHQRGGRDYYRLTAARHAPASARTSFLPLYREAARTFGVSWRLIASIHRQETAFSSAPSTYHGLNAFGCCAGPMQFNVKNRPVSTWKLYRESFRLGRRPRRYPHRTRSHPSVYDDFDAIMAAGALLRDGGASEALDGGSWSAAYAYYGHDLFGIDYANQVLGRAQGWEFNGFCVNCALDSVYVDALDDIYGDAARRQLLDVEKAKAREKRKKRREARARARRRAAEKKAREKAARSPDSDDARPAPEAPPAKTTPVPAEPQTTTQPPPTMTEPAPQPAVPAPPAKHVCTKLERLLGCRD